MSSRVALLAVVAALAAAGTGLFVVGVERGPGISDTPVYRYYGERISGGDLPYRDFAVEYPPGALVAFVLPALVSSTADGFDSAFETMMVLALTVAAVLIVLSLDALGATVGRTLALGRCLSARHRGARPVRPDAIRSLRGRGDARRRLHRAPCSRQAGLRAARARDRDEDLSRRAVLPLLVARVWRRDGPRGSSRVSLPDGRRRRGRLPPLRRARSRRRRSQRVAAGSAGPCRSRASGRVSCWRFTTPPGCRSGGPPAPALRISPGPSHRSRRS